MTTKQMCRFNGRADWMSEDEMCTVDAESFAEAAEKVAKEIDKGGNEVPFPRRIIVWPWGCSAWEAAKQEFTVTTSITYKASKTYKKCHENCIDGDDRLLCHPELSIMQTHSGD